MYAQNAANNTDGDHLSYADSDQFEEDDSVCSWNSENESLVNNWRGWRKNSNSPLHSANPKVQPDLLVNLSARAVAAYFPFEVVEQNPHPVPEELQKLVAFFSFPTNEEDIRLYSCLASGSADEFNKGEQLYKQNAVHSCLQIGFHLTASVLTRLNDVGCIPHDNNLPGGSSGIVKDNGMVGIGRSGSGGPMGYKVSLGFDRRRVIACTCTCNNGGSWCSHVVSVCLYRIHEAEQVKLRAPVSESLSKLKKDDLQKFAQNLICMMQATEILPAAQEILDQLLAASDNQLKRDRGAPDPTSGGCLGDIAAWCFDEGNLQENVRKILQKFCVPQPVIYSDPSFLTSSLPAAAQEYQNFLRPLRGKEPEGIWNLLSIIREMFRRRDNNSIPLLEIVTSNLLEMELVVIWWYSVRLNLSLPGKSSQNSAQQNHYAAASFCDEMVALWRLASLDPSLTRSQRHELEAKLRGYHKLALDKAPRGLDKMSAQRAQQSPASGGGGPLAQGNGGGHQRGNNRLGGGRGGWSWWGGAGGGHGGGWSSPNGDSMSAFSPSNLRSFPGFKPAIEACQMTWEEFPLPGITDHLGTLLSGHDQRLATDPANGSDAGMEPSSPDSSKVATSSEGLAAPIVSGASRQQRQRSNSGRRSRHASLRDTRLVAASTGRVSGSSTLLQEAIAVAAEAAGELTSSSDCVPKVNSRSSTTSLEQLGGEELASTSMGSQSEPNLTSVQGGAGGTRQWSMERTSPPHTDASVSSSSEGFCEREAASADSLLTVEGQDNISLDEGEASSATSSRRDLDQLSGGEISSNGGGQRKKSLTSERRTESEEEELSGDIFSSPQEVTYCRCQALYYHGYPREAAVLAIQLANQMLSGKDALYQASSMASLALLRGGSCTSNGGGGTGGSSTSGGGSQGQQSASGSNRLTRRQRGGGPMNQNATAMAYNAVNNNTTTSSTCSGTTDYSKLASRLMSRTLFLTSCLLEDSTSNAGLALQLCLFALCLPRPPARDRALEVKLFNQEMELLVALRRVPVSSSSLDELRKRTQDLKIAAQNNSSDTHLPYSLAVYLFEQLSLPSLGGTASSGSVPGGSTPAATSVVFASSFFGGIGSGQGWSHVANRGGSSGGGSSQGGSNSRQHSSGSGTAGPRSARLVRSAEDAKLGFEASVAVLGMKSPVSEQMHSLLVEGQRKQRHELAAQLFVMYKEDVNKLSKILDQLLDRKINPHFKAPPLHTCLTSNVTQLMNYQEPPPPTQSPGSRSMHSSPSCLTHTPPPAQQPAPSTTAGYQPHPVSSSIKEEVSTTTSPVLSNATTPQSEATAAHSAPGGPGTLPGPSTTATAPPEKVICEPRVRFATSKQGASSLVKVGSRDTDNSAVEDEENPVQSKAWEEKFRCTSFKSVRQHSVGMAAVDSSAPETTSSDNSPTTVRRSMQGNRAPLHQQDSDSSCGDHSSDSDNKAANQSATSVPAGGSQSQPSAAVSQPASGSSQPALQHQSPNQARFRSAAASPAAQSPGSGSQSSTARPAPPTPAYRGPTFEPNRPSESMAHHMFDLAQTMLNKAGGSSASAPVFNHANAFSVAHRNLQLCAFQIGLYALGLCNMLNPSWQSRTYSSHVAWISSQVMENGVTAACILLHTWKQHLNPAEVANIADRASRGRDTNMVMVAAELCLACLSECSTLNPTEILRALQQCKEQSTEMLERGLRSVESGANNSLSGVMPEIFFDLATYWYQLYESMIPGSSTGGQGQQQVQHLQGSRPQPQSMQQAAQQMLHYAASSPAAQIHFQQANQFGLPGNVGPPPTSVPASATLTTATAVVAVPPMYPGQHGGGPVQQGNHQPPATQASPFYAATLYNYSLPPPQVGHTTAAQQFTFYATAPHLLPVRSPMMVGYPPANLNHLSIGPGGNARAGGNGAFQVTYPQVAQNRHHLLGGGGAGGHLQHNRHPGHQQQHHQLQANQMQSQSCTFYLQKAFQCAMRAIKVLYQSQNGRSSDAAMSSNRDLQRFNTPQQHASKIKATLDTAKLLGSQAVQEYCNVVLCIQDQYLLQEILQLLQYQSPTRQWVPTGPTGSPGAGVTEQVLPVGSEVVNKLIMRVHTLFKKDIENRIQHIGQAQTEWDELVEVILTAQRAYQSFPSPDPILSWTHLITRIQRHPKCKQDLWQRIVAALNTMGLITRSQP